jgi:hypothetical protein
VQRDPYQLFPHFKGILAIFQHRNNIADIGNPAVESFNDCYLVNVSFLYFTKGVSQFSKEGILNTDISNGAQRVSESFS